jgi:hypothetical protein
MCTAMACSCCQLPSALCKFYQKVLRFHLKIFCVFLLIAVGLDQPSHFRSLDEQINAIFVVQDFTWITVCKIGLARSFGIPNNLCFSSA